MVQSLTPVVVANIALANIGAQSDIQSFDPSDGSTEANIVALYYRSKIDALFRAAHWGFARRQIFGTQLKAAIDQNGNLTANPPPQPWLYEYAYPSDCLKVRFCMPNLNPGGPLPNGPGAGKSGTPWSTQFSTGFGPQTNNPPIVPPTTATTFSPSGRLAPVAFVVASDFDQSGNPVKVILCNETQAQIVYTARIDDPNQWDALFFEAACATLGAWMVNAINRNAQLASEQMQIAMSIVTAARVSDGNEGFPKQDHAPDWMRIRGAHSGSWDGTHFSGWDSIAWPNGAVY